MMEGSDSEEDGLMSPEEILEKERKADPTARYAKLQARREELQRLCKQLKDKARKGTFKQTASADANRQREATAEVSRISTEMEALEAGKWGPLEKSRIPPPVRKGRGKGKDNAEIAAAVAKRKANAAATAAAMEAEEVEELPDLFDGSLGEAEAEVAPDGPQKPTRKYKMDGWTGRTPRQSLEDFVKKRLWPKGPLPQQICTFQRVSGSAGRHRVRVQVSLPRGEVRPLEPEEFCETGKEAENLAAAHALWKLSEVQDHSRLGKNLPVCFRERWREWDAEVEQRATQTMVRTKIEFLERMLRTKIVPQLPTRAPCAQAIYIYIYIYIYIHI